MRGGAGGGGEEDVETGEGAAGEGMTLGRVGRVGGGE